MSARVLYETSLEYQRADEKAVKSNALCIHYFGVLDKDQPRASSLATSSASKDAVHSAPLFSLRSFILKYQ